MKTTLAAFICDLAFSLGGVYHTGNGPSHPVYRMISDTVISVFGDEWDEARDRYSNDGRHAVQKASDVLLSIGTYLYQ